MIHDCEYIKNEELIPKYSLDWDEIFTNTNDLSIYIVKKDGFYYFDRDYDFLLSGNKFLKFTSVDDTEREHYFYFSYNAVLSNLYDVEVYVEMTTSGTKYYYYKVDNSVYVTRGIFVNVDEFVEDKRRTSSPFDFYEFSSQIGFISNGVKSGAWRDSYWITGANAGQIKSTYDNDNFTNAILNEPVEADISDAYFSKKNSNTGSFSHDNIYKLETAAGEYLSPSGQKRKIGYEKFTYDEIINEIPVSKTARKGIELFNNSNVTSDRWFIDDYRTSTEPTESNSPQTLTRESDGAQIVITYDTRVSANDPILITEGQAWR